MDARGLAEGQPRPLDPVDEPGVAGDLGQVGVIALAGEAIEQLVLPRSMHEVRDGAHLAVVETEGRDALSGKLRGVSVTAP